MPRVFDGRGVDRRSMLHITGVATAAVLAGCSSSKTQTPEPIRVGLENDHSKSHKLSVTIKSPDGTTVVSGSWSLAAGEDRKSVATFREPSSGETATFTISARMDESAETTGKYPVGGAEGRTAFDVTVRDDGTLAILPFW
jgi:hypothetical protein